MAVAFNDIAGRREVTTTGGCADEASGADGGASVAEASESELEVSIVPVSFQSVAAGLEVLVGADVAPAVALDVFAGLGDMIPTEGPSEVVVALGSACQLLVEVRAVVVTGIAAGITVDVATVVAVDVAVDVVVGVLVVEGRTAPQSALTPAREPPHAEATADARWDVAPVSSPSPGPCARQRTGQRWHGVLQSHTSSVSAMISSPKPNNPNFTTGPPFS
mmetsp:Transcript_74337/g.215438  ORF Transcript_74337/g.215438 Transcript_74337/m.215438 type:complete len:220 (+) Transcript_74337:299-958(+)